MKGMTLKTVVLWLHVLLVTSKSAFARADSSSGNKILEPTGNVVFLPFPNDQTILGVGGLVYDKTNMIWTVSSENIPGSPIEEEYPLTSSPRIYQMAIDFEAGNIDFLNGGAATIIQPSEGLKLEDIVMAPTSGDSVNNSKNDEFWLVSEANSHLVQTKTFFSKDFGAPDLSTYDPSTFATSRLVRVNGSTGQILEEAFVPDFAQWEPQVHNWDAMQCVGDRPFQGLHGVAIIPSSGESYDNLMIVAVQSALYQDGPTPTTFEGSATRILVYGLNSSDDAVDSSSTAKYLQSYRYDTSQLTLNSFQKGARHFNALFGILALNSTSMLVAECEDYLGFGKVGHKVVNRIFYVEIDPQETVDHCASLLECDVPAPAKHLVWERNDSKQLDGIAWGPDIIDSNSNQSLPTIALTFEDDDNIGVHFELFIFRANELQAAELWEEESNKQDLLRSRIIAASVTIALVLVLVIAQILYVRYLKFKSQSSRIVTSDPDAAVEAVINSRKFSFADYAMLSAMLNSFLVGGITFGFSGMVLMLRKEGTYAQNCACGSFCSKEKEQLALVSTIGFAVAIGSRLFIGLILDYQGPKTTAMLCSIICLFGSFLLASTPEANLSDTFLIVWVLLSLGGSGLHITGFHFTNLYKGDAKKAASAGISAAFGASSAVFPIMQVFNQYADIGLQSMAIFYSVLVFLVGVNNFLIQPWNKVQPGIPLKPDFKIWRAQWWKRSLKHKPILASVFEELATFDMWGETLFYSMSLLLLTHFLSTTAQLMFEKGDVPFTSDPNNWTDYMFTRMAGWFNSLGFLWYPFVQLMIMNLRWSTCYLLLFIVNIAVVSIVLAKSLEVQVIGFVLLSMGRLMLFSFHHTYILDVFGIDHFGTLNGVSSLVAAIIGLLSYPLQLMALSTNFAVSFIPIGCGILLSIAFPLILRRKLVSNWAKSYAVDPRQMRWPKDTDELVKLVKGSEKLRCAGSMHSCAPLISSEGIILSLDNFNKIIEIDVEQKVARVQSGVKIHYLCEALAPHGLAMGTLGTIDWQSIAGAVMTGTHGGSLTTQSMHAFVNSYTLVKHDGEIITVDREKEPVLFSAMAPSMGVFGVVTELEVRCVPLEYLEARMVAMPFDELIPKFENLMKTNKYARVVIYPSLMQATVWTANPVGKGEAVARGATKSTGYVNFRDENEKAWLEQFLWLSKKGKYEKADTLIRKVLESQLKRLKHYEGQYNHVLCKERNNGIPHADIEFAFDFKKNVEILEAVKAYCEKKRMPYYNFEIRTTQRDDAMLSCCYGRDTMWIDFQAKSNVSRKFFNAMKELLEPFGYRRHWAKGMDTSDPRYVVSQFPEAESFINLMDEFDPNGKFRNKEGTRWHRKMSDSIHGIKD